MIKTEYDYLYKWTTLVLNSYPHLDTSDSFQVAYSYHLLCLQNRVAKFPEELSKKEWEQHHKNMIAELPNLSEVGIEKLLCLSAQAKLMTSEMSEQELADLDQDAADTNEYVRELMSENISTDTINALAKDFLESREAKRACKGFK